MSDVIEVSYTGDLLAHRRCPRAWAYEKHAGFLAYEQAQAMEGRLLHHGMQWLSRRYGDTGQLATQEELHAQLEHFYRVLRSRGITTAFASRQEVLDRILENLFDPSGRLRRPVSAVVRGAQHTEYELRSVKKLLPGEIAGKTGIMLTGVIDLVLQQPDALVYEQVWHWSRRKKLEGEVRDQELAAVPGDEEIWDFKATRAGTRYLVDYVRQVVTYAALYKERTGKLPVRCVLFFVNERRRSKGLLVVPVDDDIIERGVGWTKNEVVQLRRTVADFERDPLAVPGGALTLRHKRVGERVDDDLSAQCTGCGQRFDCDEYRTFRKFNPKRPPQDLDVLAVGRN